MNPVLDIQDVVHTFSSGSQEQAVLRSISLQLMPAEFVLLSGPSGCGKTTLLTLIGGLRSIQHGSIKLFGNELYNSDASTRNSLRSMMGMIFQSHHLISFLTAEENVVLAMDASTQAVRTFRSKKERARQLLSELGLGDKIHFRPKQLSGGQRQRVAIARALACEPSFLIADEPTASLDAENGRLIMELLRKLVHDRGLSILMTSHDQRLYGYADRIIRIDDGRLLNS
jgi:putative ABC transport system ATP-binding protein